MALSLQGAICRDSRRQDSLDPWRSQMSGTHERRNKTQLLLVDDNPGDANLLSLVLNHRTDIHLHVVENVVQAFQFLQKRDRYVDAPDPSLILLDLNLPIYSGKKL